MDYQEYLRFLLALLFVLGLLGGLALLARKFGLSGPALTRFGPRGDARLEVVQAVPVDARRRLVLVRRDNVEHLIMLGVNQDLLIESNIKADKALASNSQGGHSASNETTRDSVGPA